MALYPSLFGHVQLPDPEPCRRADRRIAGQIDVRLVRPQRKLGRGERS
ncbi:MAG TPA: hypothetical protein VFB26_05705 [Gaiellaceae bacterium]|nr:hypothetical protein [Gaiellaceae bacterium]